MTPLENRLETRAAQLLKKSNAERIRYIQCDRFIPNAASDAVFALLDDFVTRAPSIRPPCLALIGDSDSGKSTLLNQFCLRRPPRGSNARRREVFLTTDPEPIVEVMQIALLAALNIPMPLTSHRRETKANDSIKRGLAALRIGLVIIDEIQHLLNLPRKMQSTVWDWIKWISTACRVSMACSGIPGSEHIIDSERQLHTRFTIVRLPRWEVGAAFEQFLVAFERTLPLHEPSGLGSKELQQAILLETRVMQQIGGVTGGVKKVIEYAAIEAVESGAERITTELVKAWRGAYAQAA